MRAGQGASRASAVASSVIRPLTSRPLQRRGDGRAACAGPWPARSPWRGRGRGSARWRCARWRRCAAAGRSRSKIQPQISPAAPAARSASSSRGGEEAVDEERRGVVHLADADEGDVGGGGERQRRADQALAVHQRPLLGRGDENRQRHREMPRLHRLGHREDHVVVGGRAVGADVAGQRDDAVLRAARSAAGGRSPPSACARCRPPSRSAARCGASGRSRPRRPRRARRCRRRPSGIARHHLGADQPEAVGQRGRRAPGSGRSGGRARPGPAARRPRARPAAARPGARCPSRAAISSWVLPAM